MRAIPAGAIDLILADLPFGITNCDWDKRIAMADLWAEYERLIKAAGAIILFATQPFATDLVNAAWKLFRYEIIWDKVKPTGFLNARKMPMRRHENIMVFYRSLPRYNPPGLRPAVKPHFAGAGTSTYRGSFRTGPAPASYKSKTGWPHSIVTTPSGGIERGAIPAQKPVALLEWLIRTYTRPGELVLDNVMGTGSTAIAAARTGRKFIGMELDPTRFRHAATRIVRGQG